MLAIHSSGLGRPTTCHTGSFLTSSFLHHVLHTPIRSCDVLGTRNDRLQDAGPQACCLGTLQAARSGGGAQAALAGAR